MKIKRKTSSLIKTTVIFTPIITGFVVLAGWFFNISSLKSLFTGSGNMRVNTAICFILSGFILYLLREGSSISKFKQNIVYVFTSLILLTGILSLCYYIFGWDAGINEALWMVRPQNIVNNYPGKMSLIVSINFTFLGVIFLILGKRKYHLLIQILLIAMIPGSLIVILNHLYGISFLTSIPLRAPTSMLTAILFIVLFIGVFMSPAMEYIQFSFVKKIAVFFILIILVRGTVFFAIDRNNQLGTDENKWVEHNHEVLLLAEKINTQSNNIQSGTRDYIITGNENFPLVLKQTADTIKNIMGRLRIITTGNIAHRPRLDSLEKYLNTFIASQNELVITRKNEGFEAAQKIVMNGQGIVLLSKVQSLVTDIDRDEKQIFAAYKAQDKLIVKNSSRIFTLFQVIAVLLMLAAFKMIYDHVQLRNKTEEALKKSLKETSDYRYALNESSIVAITDHNGIIKQVNDNFCKISKYIRDELIGQDHKIINAEYHPKSFVRDLWLTINNGEIWRGEIKNKAKDGTYFWLDTTIVPFMTEHGKPYQYLAIRSDITQRKNLEAEIMQMNQELQIRVEEKTKEVQESERFLNKSQEISKIGSYVLDFNKGVWKGSSELENIFGFTSNNEHTVEGWISVIHPQDQAMMKEYFTKEVIGKKQRFDKEYKIINQKTMKERCVHGIGDLEFDSNGNIVKMMGTIQDITERKNLEKELADQKLNEQKIINETTIQAQEKERKELGRELHDNVNQILATVKMYLGMVNAGDCSTEDNLLEKSHEYVNEAMMEIRKLSHSLVAPSLGNVGLKEALQLLADDANLLNDLKVELIIDEKYNEKNIDKTKELMLYRVVQEQLNNITKYSKAKEASITLKNVDDTLFLTITDNGVGFDTTQKSKGIGLTNMKSRIEFYSGNLNIISAPCQGCTLEISIPSVS